jgi:hypothetical protein
VSLPAGTKLGPYEILTAIGAGATIESGIWKFFEAVVAPAQSGSNHAVTADGQKFIIPTETRASVAEPITAILNWTSLIKK